MKYNYYHHHLKCIPCKFNDIPIYNHFYLVYNFVHRKDILKENQHIYCNFRRILNIFSEKDKIHLRMNYNQSYHMHYCKSCRKDGILLSMQNQQIHTHHCSLCSQLSQESIIYNSLDIIYMKKDLKLKKLCILEHILNIMWGMKVKGILHTIYYMIIYMFLFIIIKYILIYTLCNCLNYLCILNKVINIFDKFFSLSKSIQFYKLDMHLLILAENKMNKQNRKS